MRKHLGNARMPKTPDATNTQTAYLKLAIVVGPINNNSTHNFGHKKWKCIWVQLLDLFYKMDFNKTKTI